MARSSLRSTARRIRVEEHGEIVAHTAAQHEQVPHRMRPRAPFIDVEHHATGVAEAASDQQREPRVLIPAASGLMATTITHPIAT